MVLEGAFGKMRCQAGGFSRIGALWMYRWLSARIPGYGFSVAGTVFPKPGTVFSKPGALFPKPGAVFPKPPIEKTKPPIENSISGTGISIGGVGRYFCCTLPLSLIHLTHGRKTWLKGLKTYAHARVHAYAHT